MGYWDDQKKKDRWNDTKFFDTRIQTNPFELDRIL